MVDAIIIGDFACPEANLFDSMYLNNSVYQLILILRWAKEVGSTQRQMKDFLIPLTLLHYFCQKFLSHIHFTLTVTTNLDI